MSVTIAVRRLYYVLYFYETVEEVAVVVVGGNGSTVERAVTLQDFVDQTGQRRQWTWCTVPMTLRMEILELHSYSRGRV